MITKISLRLVFALLCAAVFLTLGGCGSLAVKERQRFFWPPPPAEPKIEYINFYYSDEDLLRGVDRRLETAILGKRNPQRVISNPYSVASDGKGRIFVCDFSGRKVVVLDQPNHTSRILKEMTGAPQKVLVDKEGEIWALDSINAIVYRFAVDEKLLSELKLKGIDRVASLAVDSQRQRLYLSDVPNHRICVYDYAGTLLTTFGTRGQDAGQFNYPADLDLDSAGNLYIVDTMNARIQILSPDGVFIRSFGERGTQSGSFAFAKGIAVSPSGLVYVSDSNLNKVVIFSANGDYLLTLGGYYAFDGRNVQPGGLNFPSGIDADANDTVFLADYYNGMIHEFQYLTPAFLAQQPIKAPSVYSPQPSDFQRSAPGGSAPFLPPAAATGSGEEKIQAIKPQID